MAKLSEIKGVAIRHAIMTRVIHGMLKKQQPDRSQEVSDDPLNLEHGTVLDLVTKQPSIPTEEADGGLDDPQEEGIDAIMAHASDKSTAYLSALEFPEPVRAPKP
eukprot:5811688-Pyramimonas_sp.AAC.2